MLLLQEIDDLLTGALTPDDEEAVEEELEKIIQAEMPEVPAEELSAAEPAMPDVPAEPGSQRDCLSLSFAFHALCSQFKSTVHLTTGSLHFVVHYYHCMYLDLCIKTLHCSEVNRAPTFEVPGSKYAQKIGWREVYIDFFSPIREMSGCCCMTTFFHIHSSLLCISSCQVTF